MLESFAAIILTSAAVSAMISGIFLFLSERSKRISEEKRTKMEIAIRLTELHDKKVLETLKLKPKKVFWGNHSRTFKLYYDYLEKIWGKKEVPKDFDSPIID